MRTVRIPNDGEAIHILVMKDGKPIARHMVMAMGPCGALAYVQGGFGVPDDAPTVMPDGDDEVES